MRDRCKNKLIHSKPDSDPSDLEDFDEEVQDHNNRSYEEAQQNHDNGSYEEVQNHDNGDTNKENNIYYRYATDAEDVCSASPFTLGN